MTVDQISEIVIVEGNSGDNTWDVAKEIQKKYPTKVKITQQPSTGKFNAVLHGSHLISTDLILVWDADGTVSVRDTKKIIYLSIASGHPVIGDRLRGEIAEGAMQTANWFGNWFFALLWSPIIWSKPTDMLCGTKIFPRHIFNDLPNWLIKNDPYGDFALVAFARANGLKILSYVVDYKPRAYGVTNINRWQGALQLFITTIKVYLSFVFHPSKDRYLDDN